MDNQVVPPGVSGREVVQDFSTCTVQDIACELALNNLGDFEPLDFKLNVGQFMKEISFFKNDWVDYLPRTDVRNNRKGLVLSNLPGKSHQDNPSLPQACLEAKRRLSEADFNERTEVYDACESLHPLLDYFSPLGRTFLVNCGIGGFFVPHRDQPYMPRETFRVAVFLNKCGPYEYDWLVDDKKINIELGRAYYINTRRMHRTISWANDSIHLIMNIPFTPENVSKCIAKLQHRH